MFLPRIVVSRLAGEDIVDGNVVNVVEAGFSSRASKKLAVGHSVLILLLSPVKGADDPSHARIWGHVLGSPDVPDASALGTGSQAGTVLTTPCLRSYFLAGSDGPCPWQLLAVSEDGQTHHRAECLLLLLRIRLLLWPWGQRDPGG